MTHASPVPLRSSQTREGGNTCGQRRQEKPRGPSALTVDELCELLENLSPPCAALSLRAD